MANFARSFEVTMGHEGGYANNPDDRGGETYKGVARKFHPQWRGWAAVDIIKAKKPLSLNAALDADKDLQKEIRTFYKKNFWDVNRTGDIQDQQIANQLFDFAVNSGAGMAARILQKAAGVEVDGQVGPITIAAVNKAKPEAFFNALIKERKAFYERIVLKDPSQRQFLAGWFKRLGKYKNQA